jgi:hypothetical protein
MRTTVTLDPDVAEKLKRLAHARRTSFKETLNDALRRGLSGPSASGVGKPFRVRAQASGFRPGVDHQRLNQLVDQLAADEAVARAGR